MDKKIVEELLNKIVNDCDYRRRLETHPVETLAEIGISIDPELVRGGVRLPPPDKVCKLWLEAILRNDEVGLTNQMISLFKA